MSYIWKQENIPHKGWRLDDVIDIRDDDQPEWDTPYETCMMCGNEKIRYIHLVSHPELREQYRVGCVCAEKMTNDYTSPRKMETNLRNRANRRKTWKNKKWSVSKSGNFFLKYEQHHILIYKDKKTGKYKVKVGDTFGKKPFDTVREAKNAAFNGVELFKQQGKW